MNVGEVVVEGLIRTEVHLTLDERTGKWRTSTHYILPPGTPTAPALLKTVNGEAPMGSILAAVEAKPHSVHRLCLVPAAPPPSALFEKSSSSSSSESGSSTSGSSDSAGSESSGASSTSSKTSSTSKPSSTSSKKSSSKTSPASSARSSPTSSKTSPSKTSSASSASSQRSATSGETSSSSSITSSASASKTQPTQSQAQAQPKSQSREQLPKARPKPQPQQVEEQEQPDQPSQRETAVPAEAEEKEEGPTELLILVMVEAEEGELPGIQLNRDLIVTKVDRGGLLEGKIDIGDVLLKFNRDKLKSRDEFAARWNIALHKGVGVEMEFVRREGAAEALRASLLPPELEKMISRKNGHEYLLRQLDPEKGPLGVALETLLNRVVVVALRQGSIGAALFKRWDVILVVEGTRVSDAQVAKHIIRDRGGKFSAVVERGPESKWPEWAKTLAAKKANSVTNESVDWDQGPADVRLIAATALAARKAGVVPAKPILKSQSYLAKSSNPPQSISFDPMQTVTTIASDLEHNKPLRKVPRQ